MEITHEKLSHIKGSYNSNGFQVGDHIQEQALYFSRNPQEREKHEEESKQMLNRTLFLIDSVIYDVQQNINDTKKFLIDGFIGDLGDQLKKAKEQLRKLKTK